MDSKTFLETLAEFLATPIGNYNVFTYLFIAIICMFFLVTVKKRIIEVKEHTNDYQTLIEFKKRCIYIKENIHLIWTKGREKERKKKRERKDPK